MRFYITSLQSEPEHTPINSIDPISRHIRLEIRVYDDEINLPESLLYLPYSDYLFTILVNCYSNSRSFELNLSDLQAMAESVY